MDLEGEWMANIYCKVIIYKSARI